MADKVYSGKLRNKNNTGGYDELRPFNTINEVFYDIDNSVQLQEVLGHLIDFKAVKSLDDMYKLTANDVIEGATIIKVVNGYTYRVVDVNNLSNADGYERVTNLGASTTITLTTFKSTDVSN